MDEPRETQDPQAPTDDEAMHAGVPIVAIGASAGGLEPLQMFFSKCPSGLGLAFVVMQHLPPGGDSKLAAILAKSTDMPVAEITGAIASTAALRRPGRQSTCPLRPARQPVTV